MSKYSENMPPELKDAVNWMYDDIDIDKTLLDVGCATGYFGNLLKRQKHNMVYGIEISDDRYEAEKVLDGVYSFDIDSDTWPEEIYERSYDYIFIGDVIEHLKNPQACLTRFSELLTDDGILFISTPNIAHISIRLELMRGDFEYEDMGILDNTHLKYFTKQSLTRMVVAAGYKLESIDYTLNDYPDLSIKKALSKVGLEPTQKFWNLVETPEARAFQWKLKLRKRRLPEDTLRQNTQPPLKPEILRNSEVDDLKSRAKTLKIHADNQAEIIAHQGRMLEDLKNKNIILQTELEVPLKKRVAAKLKQRLKKA